MKRAENRWGADDYLLLGFAGAVLSGVIGAVVAYAGDAASGVTIAWIGGVMFGIFFMIGIIAKGVQVGNRPF
jgi:ABC-type Mn2+/Zn2+ transport system permease subunit